MHKLHKLEYRLIPKHDIIHRLGEHSIALRVFVIDSRYLPIFIGTLNRRSYEFFILIGFLKRSSQQVLVITLDTWSHSTRRNHSNWLWSSTAHEIWISLPQKLSNIKAISESVGATWAWLSHTVQHADARHLIVIRNIDVELMLRWLLILAAQSELIAVMRFFD